jgi:hypothetical protein
MTRQKLFIAVFALGAMAFCSREAAAQYGVGGYGVNYGDTVSPYLNLLSAGNGAGLGTQQNLVDSLINNKQANINTAAGINQLQNQINGGGRGGGRGNPSMSRHFMNYSHYYIGIRR